MKNSTLIMTAVMAVASTAVKAQSLTLPMHKRAVRSLVMKPQASPIVSMPGVKSTFSPAKGLTPGAGSRKAQARATMQRLKARAMKARAAAAEKVWASAEETSYMLNEDGNGWDFDSQNTYKYDANGRVATVYAQGNETGDDGVTSMSFTRTDISYTDDGRTLDQTLSVSSDGGDSYTPSQRLSRTYDEVAPWLHTFMGYYTWNADESTWEVSSQANKYSYTRDADNNITGAIFSAPYQGEWEAVRRITNTVDPATKQIKSFRYESYGYDDNGDLTWAEDQYLTDIKWKETNGQVASEYEEDPSQNWFNNGNYLLSATVSSTGTDGTVSDMGAISVTYDANGGYTETKTYVYSEEYEGTTYSADCKDEYRVTVTDEATGSFEIEYKSWADYDGDGVFTGDEMDYHEIEVVAYDAHGNLTRDLGYDMPEDEGGDGDATPISDTDAIDATATLTYKGLVLVQGGLNVFQYDAGHGNAMKQQISYDFDGESSFVPQNKIVVDEYVDLATTAVKGVTAGEAGATAVYTLEGVKVGTSLDTVPRGTYIVKSGAGVRKVAKK